MARLESRFGYEVALSGDADERDRVMEMVRREDPSAWWAKVDGKYVICTNIKSAAMLVQTSGQDPEIRKRKKD